MRGEDVLKLQMHLRELGYAMVGQPDGLFGPRTETAVHTFQQSRGLKADGTVGPITWTALFEDAPSHTGASPDTAVESNTALEKVEAVLTELAQRHSYRDSSLSWYLSARGLVTINPDASEADEGELEISGGEPHTVRRVWQNFSTPVEEWASKFGVPIELIIATICTETRGDPSAVREEPGYISDAQTPNKVSPGLMQTLISTAQDVLGDDTIDRTWLLVPGNSIRAGTAYIARQWKTTHFDPPKVACAYNAGGIYYNASSENRWKMRQYPINSSEHADRFVKWFNDCFLMFYADNLSPRLSLFRRLQA